MVDRFRRIKRQYIENIAKTGGRPCPIIDDSDDEEVVIKRDKNGKILLDNKERTELEEMFSRDDAFFSKVLDFDKNGIDDPTYVKMCIKQARAFFNIDRGHSEAKKANLGDIKSTKIDTPPILNFELYDLKMEQEKKAKTVLKANVKALIPLMREKFTLEQEEIGLLVKDKYKLIETEPLREKRIFGVAVACQVGHIPNLQISFTEDEENFNRDTYTFKQLMPSK